MGKKLYLISNVASHYRYAIYSLIDKEYDTQFIFSKPYTDIKSIPLDAFKKPIIEVPTWRKGDVSYQRGVLRLLFKKSRLYMLAGDTKSISTWFFLLLARLFPKKKTIVWAHGWYGHENRITTLLKKLFFRLPNKVLLYGNYAKQLMVAEGFKEGNLVVIHNSLNYDTQLTIRKQLRPQAIYQDHFGNNNKNIVFIGRLTAVKRFDLLIDAVALLKERGELVNLTFIGDGVERENMETLVEEKDIKEQVWFYGACYDERTNAELIYNADVCVSPGNIGLTAIHVLMFGCPAITNDDFCHQMPEFEAIQDGKTGAFFKAQDSFSLADTINQWFASYGGDRTHVREACYKEIDSGWNPHNQIRIIKTTTDSMEVFNKQEITPPPHLMLVPLRVSPDSNDSRTWQLAA